MEPRITLITLGVSDLERSTAFYKRIFGISPRPDTEGVSFFELKSTWLALFPRSELAKDAGVPDSEPGFGGFALAHNVRTREEVDRVLKEAVAAGARLARPAHDADWGGYSGYFTDPDGHLWEIAWNPHFWVE